MWCGEFFIGLIMSVLNVLNPSISMGLKVDGGG
jgi:hypothetical protein